MIHFIEQLTEDEMGSVRVGLKEEEEVLFSLPTVICCRSMSRIRGGVETRNMNPRTVCLRKNNNEKNR